MKFNCILFLLFSNSILNAQTNKNIDQQSLLWTRYSNQLIINKKWSIHNDFDNRIFTKPAKQNLFVYRLQGRYKLNEQLETGIGFAYFLVSTQDPHINYDFKFPEYRGQQEITRRQNFNKLTIYERFQVEERFFQNTNEDGLISGTTFFWRFRYRIQGDYLVWEKDNQYIKTILSDELMINAGEKVIKNTFDQNRIYGAIQYGINKNVALELGYLNSFQQRSNGTDYFNRDIIRFSIIHKINLKKVMK
jgi:hypothetical protein